MNRIRLWASQVATIVAFLSEPAAGENVILRVSPSASKEAVRFLAHVTNPSTIQVESSSELNSILKHRCGTVTPAYLEVLKDFNNGLVVEKIYGKTTVLLPACFHYELRAIVKVFPNDSVWRIATRHTGWAGPQTVGTILKANFDTVSDSDVPIIYPNQELKIPFKSDRVSYDLKPGINPQTVIKTLRSIANSNDLLWDGSDSAWGSFSIIEAESGADHVTHIGPASASTSTETDHSCTPGTANDANWPFESSGLAATLRYNDKIAVSNGMIVPTRATVAVADSGLSGYNGAIFPSKLFKLRRAELLGQPTIDDDRNGYIDDVYGANIPAGRGPPHAFRDYAMGDHGTHVAGLILGGPSFKQFRELLTKKLQFTILNLIDRQTVASKIGPSTRFTSIPSSISEAIAYAKLNGATIVNISFAADARLLSFEDSLKGNPQLLVVASAGNSSSRLEQIVQYPAGYGGSSSIVGSQVITVAAHDAKFQLIPQSNWSPTVVDIAAPGCAIESYSFGGTLAEYDGTSQAAPLVTLAAALLYSEGVEAPQQIKNRLIASADPKPGLYQKVVAHGSLNIIKALSVYRDAISLVSEDNLLLGNITSPTEFELCDGWPSVPIHDVAKIVPRFPPPDGDHTFYLVSNAQGRVSSVICPKNSRLRIEIQIDNETAPRKLDIDEIEDIVIATYR